MAIRIVTSRDIDALRNIYAQYIAIPVTFEYTLPSLQDFAARVQGILSTYPYLVWEENRQVLGYAYAHRQKEREIPVERGIIHLPGTGLYCKRHRKEALSYSDGNFKAPGN